VPSRRLYTGFPIIHLSALVAGETHDAVTDVVVEADDVGVLVVNEVVGLLPVHAGRGGVPLPFGGVNLGIVHPIPLPVRDVVPEFHVLDDLGDGQHRRPGAPRHFVAAGEQGDPAARGQRALPLDG